MEAEAIIPRPFLALASAACFVVVVAGLKVAGDLALPVIFSGFLAMLVWPAVRFMVGIGIPKGLAIAAVMLVVAATMVGGTAIMTDSMARFSSSIPQYQEPVQQAVRRANELLESRGLDRVIKVERLVDPSSLIAAVRTMASAIISVLSNVLIVVLTTSLLLLEATELGTKVKVAFGETGGTSWVERAGDKVQRYLVIKSAFSVLTGLLVAAFTAALGLDLPVLWGLIAFVFNFVPAVGSIFAAVPAVVLALVSLGPGHALVATLGYVVVNVAIGNFIEPRLLGRRLGLSPFVVVACLLFWGYVWGPAGMLIGVPLTVIFKLVLETSPQTRWLAVLLGGADEAVALDAPEGQEPAV